MMVSKHEARTVCAGLAILASGAAAGWAMAPGLSLYINGKLASSSVIVHEGAAYVPIKDVAAAFQLVTEKRTDGFALSKPGGSNQVEGLTGKIGDPLFNGRYRFQVIKVLRGPTYTNQFKGDGYVVEAPSPDLDVVSIVCRIKNGAKDTVQVDLFSGAHTALTDEDEHSFAVKNMTWSDSSDRVPKILPGSAWDFALTFFAPKTAVLKDLVFTPQDYERTQSQDFRVSLKQPTTPRP